MYKSLMFGNGKISPLCEETSLFSDGNAYYSVDKKAGFSAFSTGKKKKTGLIHSYPQLLTVIPRSLWKTFNPCPRGQIEIDKVGITVEKGWALWKKEDLYTAF